MLAWIIFVLNIFAIYSIVRAGMDFGPTLLWVFLVLLLPVIGIILWFTLGNK